MPGLFSDVRGFFDAKYSGRYLALLLRELARRSPTAFAQALQLPSNESRALRRSELQVEREQPFKASSGKQRRADLAILSGGKPITLIEVKEDDVRNPANTAQLDDYLRVGCRFVHISRYQLPEADARLIDEAKRQGSLITKLTYHDIYSVVANKKDLWSTLLRDYLEDIGVNTYKSITLAPDKEGKAVALLLVQILGFPHFQGLGRLHSDAAVMKLPEILKILFGNLDVFATWLRDASPDSFRNRFTRKFRPDPYYKLTPIRSLQGEEERIPGAGRHITKGDVYFFTYGKIRNAPQTKQISSQGDWLYIEMGYLFSIACNDDRPQPVDIHMYVSIFGQGLDNCYQQSKCFNSFPAQKEATRALSKCLRKARESALSQISGAIHEALAHMIVPTA